MSRQLAFGITLIIILVCGVIAFSLGLFLGLAWGASATFETDSQQDNAIEDIVGINGAINQYVSFKGWNSFSESSVDHELTSAEAGRVILMLCGNKSPKNPSGIGFLIPRKSLSGSFPIFDPWNRPYRIAIDGDNDGFVETKELGRVATSTRVIVWSDGPGPLTSWSLLSGTVSANTNLP